MSESLSGIAARTAVVVDEVPVATTNYDDLGAGTFECVGIHSGQLGDVVLDPGVLQYQNPEVNKQLT